MNLRNRTILLLPILLVSRYSVFSQNFAQLKETYADSTTIGRKGHNKLLLRLYQTDDSTYVMIQFFAKQKSKWKLKNNYSFEKDVVIGCDPKIRDFNKDGLKDLTYVSGIAARGANEVRSLFIYSKTGDSLTYIKNSEEYPNLRYNSHLNCINSLIFTGICTDVFLKLEGDILREIAQVDEGDELVVTEYDKNGKEKIIYRKKKNTTFYTAFKSYKPLIPER